MREADLLVYHGTSKNSPQLIIQNGFNVAYGTHKKGSSTAKGRTHLTDVCIELSLVSPCSPCVTVCLCLLSSVTSGSHRAAGTARALLTSTRPVRGRCSVYASLPSRASQWGAVQSPSRAQSYQWCRQVSHAPLLAVCRCRLSLSQASRREGRTADLHRRRLVAYAADAPRHLPTDLLPLSTHPSRGPVNTRLTCSNQLSSTQLRGLCSSATRRPRAGHLRKRQVPAGHACITCSALVSYSTEIIDDAYLPSGLLDKSTP